MINFFSNSAKTIVWNGSNTKLFEKFATEIILKGEEGFILGRDEDPKKIKALLYIDIFGGYIDVGTEFIITKDYLVPTCLIAKAV